MYCNIEEFGDEIAVRCRTAGQEEGAPVRVGEQTDVDQDLVTQYIDIEFGGHIANEFHEQFAFVQPIQLPTPFPAMFASTRQNYNIDKLLQK